MRHPRMMGIKHEALERDLDRMCVFTMGSEIVIKATDINQGEPREEEDLKLEELINTIKYQRAQLR